MERTPENVDKLVELIISNMNVGALIELARDYYRDLFTEPNDNKFNVQNEFDVQWDILVENPQGDFIWKLKDNV